ncbi:MAG: tyrosine--tRNA ligase [Pyrinomonadaceae bacterium]
MSVWDEFNWRGTIYDATEGLPAFIAEQKLTAYVGFDPTASSLHVGSLLPVMSLARLQRHGHSPIAVVGGGTGLIGDPSGKSQERYLLSREQVNANLLGIKEQLERFLDFRAVTNPARIVNNADWLTTISMMDFLRDVGKHFTVNYMLGKESVSRRLDKDQGISFTEFSYMLLQAYDFLMLKDQYDCMLQMGGSDQWGNILAGVELIRRTRGSKAHGLVFPLLTTAGGLKFGKTEAGTVWLDPKLTSPFRFYQFWLNADDKDVVLYLKFFTFLTREEIEGWQEELKTAPEKREAQRTLAREVTRLVHGSTELEKAEKSSRVLFGGDISGINVADVLEIFIDVPSHCISSDFFNSGRASVIDLAVSSEVVSSKGEARRLVLNGGLYLNNRRVSDIQQRVELSDCIGGQVLILRKGQKQYHLVKIV